jgi:predicted acetyltransferase
MVNYSIEDIGLLTFVFHRMAVIKGLGVSQEHRGKGYGKILLDDALARIKAEYPAIIMLETGKDNKVAQSLYENAGFKKMFEPTEKHVSVAYMQALEVPHDKRPYGNIIQRHPKTALATVVSMGILTALARSKILRLVAK